MERDIIRFPDKLGENLKQLRNIKEFSVNSAAERLGISTAYLSLIEKGSRQISDIMLFKLLKIYRYSLARFVSETLDSVDHFKVDSSDYVINEKKKILLFGSREQDKSSIKLLRPLRHRTDSEMLEIFLPPEQELPDEKIAIDAEIRGVVCCGKLLVDFTNDEFTALEGDEFIFDGSKAHSYRNYSYVPLKAWLIINPPNF